MFEERHFLDDPRPDGREPIPAEMIGDLIPIFEDLEAIQLVLAFTVRAEGVMQSDATFGVWVDEALPHEDKVETLRQLASRIQPMLEPDYYVDLMLVTPRDAQLWMMASEHGDPIYAREEEDIQRQIELLSQLPPIDEEERDIDIMRVM